MPRTAKTLRTRLSLAAIAVAMLGGAAGCDALVAIPGYGEPGAQHQLANGDTYEVKPLDFSHTRVQKDNTIACTPGVHSRTQLRSK